MLKLFFASFFIIIIFLLQASYGTHILSVMNGAANIMSINTGIINYQNIKSSVEATLPFSKSVSIKFVAQICFDGIIL